MVFPKATVFTLLILLMPVTLTQAFFSPTIRVCYDSYGCFERGTGGLLGLLPQEPSDIGTTFHLFTSSNQMSSKILDDNDNSKLSSSNYNIFRRTIFVVHGYSESISTWAQPMKEALLDKEDCNVILVDWSKGASGNYFQAAENTRLVGKQIAVFIKFLISSNGGSSRLADKFYIVGFSLGAHVAGYAGSYFQDYGMTLRRITGLDPAGLYFTNAGENFRLDKSDASFVDVIHTDAGFAGTSKDMGDADFYPNGGSKQPGCPFKLQNIVESLSCDHMRAPDYYTASVKGPCPWKAYPCNDYKSFEDRKCLQCNPAECSKMGYNAADGNKKGKFYLKTNGEAPFCDETP